MSVIIEGLTLPKHNPKEIDKNVLIGDAIVKEDNTAELCLEGVHYLIKILPAPHGRLIDEEAIYNNVKSRCNNCHIRACAICGVTCILNDIRTAPTIIEAEVSE